MRIKSLQNAIEYSKRLSDIQALGQNVQNVIPGVLIEADYSILSVAFSPDGSLLVIARQNGVLDVIDWNEKCLVKQFSAISPNGPDSSLPVISCKFGSDNSKFVAAGCSGEIFICNIDSGSKSQINGIEYPSNLMSMDISPSSTSNIVAGYKDGVIRIFDSASKKLLKSIDKAGENDEFEENASNGHSMRVSAVRWIPSGYDNVFVSAGWDGSVKVWDTRLAQPLVKQFKGAKVCGEGIDVKDRIILTACWSATDQLQVFDLASSRRLMTATSPFPCDYLYSGRILSTIESSTSRMQLKAAVGGCAGVLSVLSIEEVDKEYEVSPLAIFSPEATDKNRVINCLDASSVSSAKSHSSTMLALGLNDGRCFVCKMI